LDDYVGLLEYYASEDESRRAEAAVGIWMQVSPKIGDVLCATVSLLFSAENFVLIDISQLLVLVKAHL
jgi:hypothetical protein